ncbi:MAG TPA: hypothetical protein VF116_15095 [Ktedonobacterales bacterium]
MFNPQFVEHEIATHQASLRREAEIERLAREAQSGTTAHEGQRADAGVGEAAGLRSRLGDLLLAYGLRLKRLDTPAILAGGTTPAIPPGAQLALVATAPLPAATPASAPALAQPVSGFSLLRYETLPPVGVFFWRLDRFGAGLAGRQGYLTLTWIAAGDR